jgi:5-methylcytosine-specific restriction endonuclease McrA
VPSTNAPHLVHPGDTYGRLTVLGFSHNDKRSRRHYTVQCHCGTVKTVQGTLLRSGNTQSCGCLAHEQRKATRLAGNHGEITAVILGYKRHASARGLAWNLTRGHVSELIAKPCHYCGSPPSNTKITKNTVSPLIYSGIDRIDNARGYEPDNVAPCCSTCNVAKGIKSLDEFRAWIERISTHAAQWSGLMERDAA